MSLFRAWILRSSRQQDPRPLPAVTDSGLLVLTDAYLANDRSLQHLLESDGRDTDDIPGFSDLADRQAGLVALIAGTPAQTFPGLLAKARCARLHPAERGCDAATDFALSLADDLLWIHGTSSLPFLLSSFPSQPRFSTPKEEHIMNNLSDAERLAILRRNAVWRHTSETLTYIGAFATVALIFLLLNGVALTWLALAALVVTSVVSTGLGFFVLQFIRHLL